MCNAATCLSLWHAAHLITALQSLSWWLLKQDSKNIFGTG